MFSNQNMMEGDKNDREDGDEYDVMINKIYVSVGTQTETQEEDQIVTMWHLIETGIGQKVPIYLKNIMRLEGYDTIITIQRMSADNIKELEHFSRTEMLKFIKEGEKHSDYFDKYHICPSEFRIPTGHRVLLSEIQKFVANKLSMDKMYFTPELRLEKSNCQSRKLTKSTTNQKRKIYANQVASEPQNKNSQSSSQHTSSGSNPNTPVEINLNTEHDSLYALVMVWLKKQSKVSI